MLPSKLFVLCLVFIASVSAVDYCSKTLCKDKNHIACNNNDQFGPSCPSNATLLKMTPKIQQLILDTHNELRNKQAKGETPGYEPAKRMATLRWDPELAKFAELNARTCVFAHDPCHNTETYNSAGQNIALTLMTPYFYDDEKAITEQTHSWFDEYKNGDMNVINNFSMPPVDSSVQVGHFTQVVRDAAYAIGCAVSKYDFNYQGQDNKATLYVCNYSLTNIFGAKVYESGPTASACKTGTNSKYPGLCSPKEMFEGWYYN